MTVEAEYWHTAYPNVARVLVGRDQIARRVKDLSAQIRRDCAGGDLTVLAVLTGSVVFLADLIRQLPLQLELKLAPVSSYPGRSVASRGPRLLGPLPDGLAGRRVLLVDDIIDGGATLSGLAEKIHAQGSVRLRTCVLLRKDRPDVTGRIVPDYVGFEVPNEFVVGYGLDFNGLYRNLPDVCVLKSLAGAACSPALGEES